MKAYKKLLLLVTIVLAILLFSLCSYALDETGEENGELFYAQTIKLGEKVNGISDYCDDDWYKFVLPSDGYIEIKFSHNYGLSHHYVHIFDDDGQDGVLIGKFTVDYKSLDNRQNIYKYGLPKGEHYINVYGTNAEYNFTVNFTSSSVWEKEINDNMYNSDNEVACNKINEGTNYYASLENNYGGYDDDYYYLNVNSSKKLYVDINKSYGYGLYVSVIEYDGTNEKELFDEKISSESKNDSSDVFTVNPSKDYFIHIHSGEHCEYNFTVKPYTSSVSENDSEEMTDDNGVTGDTDSQNNRGYQDVPPIDGLEHYEQDGFTYVNVQDGAIIIGYSGNDVEILIPDSLGGRTVIGIFHDAFSGMGITIVNIPSTVTRFGNNIFDENTTIICDDNSPAAKYAEEHGISHQSPYTEENTYANAETGSPSIWLIIVIVIVSLVVAGGITAICIVTAKKKNKSQLQDAGQPLGYNEQVQGYFYGGNENVTVEIRRCWNCKKQLNDNEKFCTQCGSKN